MQLTGCALGLAPSRPALNSHRNHQTLIVVVFFNPSLQVRDKQIVRLIGKIPGLAAAAYHKHTARLPSLQPTAAKPLPAHRAHTTMPIHISPGRDASRRTRALT